MSKEVILTGIRANNDLTIGNYFGAMLPMIDMATTRSDQYQINMFVPDLHSITTPIDMSTLQENIWHNLRLFVAAGLPLSHPDIHIYRQSYIPAHSELAWILSCFTGFGEMSRMTQFKDKSTALAENRVSIGLFSYPVLMAADILLYNASYVPVGEDQTQHLEFTRDIAERMNTMAEKYGYEPILTVPKDVKSQHAFFSIDHSSKEAENNGKTAGQQTGGLRIKDLQDPSKKMSKSDDSDKGVIFLGDNPDEAAKKIMSATTDSAGAIHFDWDKQPGITNLLQILALLTHRNQTEVNHEWEGKSSYGEFKSAVAEAAKTFLTDLQTKLSQIDDKAIQAKLEISENSMREQANQTLLKVQKAVGLR